MMMFPFSVLTTRDPAKFSIKKFPPDAYRFPFPEIFLIFVSLPKHFKVISPFKFSPIISPPEARHEIVFPSIFLRVIEPPLL